ncbi:unnamed protein product [Malus baccata var. baccata]
MRHLQRHGLAEADFGFKCHFTVGLLSDYNVETINDGLNEFNVEFHGPKESPLNGDAASLMMKDRKLYDQKVKEYCERHAKKEHITNTTPDEERDENISDEESKLKGQ